MYVKNTFEIDFFVLDLFKFKFITLLYCLVNETFKIIIQA